MKTALMCPLCGLEVEDIDDEMFSPLARYKPPCRLCGSILLHKEKFLQAGSWFEFCRRHLPDVFARFPSYVEGTA